MLAIAVLIVGLWLDDDMLTIGGIIPCGHSDIERVFGFFFKFHDHFNPTRPVHIRVENNAGIN
ncbi:DUF4260 family protein [Anditalea andensis]|uniref:Uncharacterized protein n=1 Tax=Anditalea andensis TaxID=1048983 RepID=A0A074KYM8_9BACT|nr:DUF4260 family protein [Anditalea andensis]KEO72708.1 hypothetical protein EL17_18425 [Anditalea andensis]